MKYKHLEFIEKGNTVFYESYENGNYSIKHGLVVYLDDEVIIDIHGVKFDRKTGISNRLDMNNTMSQYNKILYYKGRYIDKDLYKKLIVKWWERILVWFFSILYHSFMGFLVFSRAVEIDEKTDKIIGFDAIIAIFMAFIFAFIHVVIVDIFDVSEPFKQYPDTFLWNISKKFDNSKLVRWLRYKAKNVGVYLLDFNSMFINIMNGTIFGVLFAVISMDYKDFKTGFILSYYLYTLFWILFDNLLKHSNANAKKYRYK